MSKLNTMGVDLAKNIIQVSVVSRRGKERQNKALRRNQFTAFLGQQQPGWSPSKPVPRRILDRRRVLPPLYFVLD